MTVNLGKNRNKYHKYLINITRVQLHVKLYVHFPYGNLYLNLQPCEVYDKY